jgi:C4-dicarboxylate-specific signal transduction histidine kinase
MSSEERSAGAARDIARLLDEAPFGYALLRDGGIVAHANRTLATWLGTGRRELKRGASFRQLLAPASRLYFDTHVNPLLARRGEATEIALDLQAQSGERVPVLLNASVGEWADGATVTQLALQLVKERRRYEVEIRAERRCAEDSLTQLREAQLRLVELSQFNAMSTLSSSLAHELNQPLTAVSNLLAAAGHLLRSDRGSETIDRAVADANAAALRAGEIIRKMRGVAQGATSAPGLNAGRRADRPRVRERRTAPRTAGRRAARVG